jgi:hypothetical protein
MARCSSIHTTSLKCIRHHNIHTLMGTSKYSESCLCDHIVPDLQAVVPTLYSLLLHCVMLIEGTVCKTQSLMVSRQPLVVSRQSRLWSPCAAVARVWSTMSTPPGVAFRTFSTYDAFEFALHSNATKVQHNLPRPDTVFVS